MDWAPSRLASSAWSGAISQPFGSQFRPARPIARHLPTLPLCLLLAGGARFNGVGSLRPVMMVLTVLYFIFALLWLPRVIRLSADLWHLGWISRAILTCSCGAGCLRIFGAGRSGMGVRTARIGRSLYGICVLSFALDHFFALKETAKMVPTWIPPGQHVLGRGDRDFSPARRHRDTLGSSGLFSPPACSPGCLLPLALWFGCQHSSPPPMNIWFGLATRSIWPWLERRGSSPTRSRVVRSTAASPGRRPEHWQPGMHRCNRMSASTVSTGMAASTPRRGAGTRVTTVDALRGFVMVLMPLDHTREFFTNFAGNPLDPQHTTFMLYLTRWMTHLCAPVFVFLAGTSIYLQQQRKTKRQLTKLLLTRGLWLIIVELTLVHLVFNFHWQWNVQLLEVIWVIGASMMIMAALIHLSVRWNLIIGALLILGHNALDGVMPASFGPLGWLWRLLHVPGSITGPPMHPPIVIVAYPLLPWVGVMALGYAFGSVLLKDRDQRLRFEFRAGRHDARCLCPAAVEQSLW